MASGEQGKEVAQRQQASDLSPRGVKQIEKASEYARTQEKDMRELKQEVDNMGVWSLWWDAKGIFEKSDPEVIKTVIIKHSEFFKQFQEVITKIRNGKETDAEKNIYTFIVDLYEDASQLTKAAKNGKETPSSSTLCNLYEGFLRKQEELDNMIRRVECVWLTKAWKESCESIQNLRIESAANYNKLSDKFDKVITDSNKLQKQNNIMLDEIKQLREERKEGRNKMEEEWKKREEERNKMEEEWKKREEERNKMEEEWKKREEERNKMEEEWKKREEEMNKIREEGMKTFTDMMKMMKQQQKFFEDTTKIIVGLYEKNEDGKDGGTN